MAQLPPKPPITQNWPSIPLQMIPITTASAATTQPRSWVDEFLDFSAARRSTHRRSETDSIAFLPLLEECPTPSPPRSAAHRSTFGFERLDDEQLMSMFADDVEVKVAAPPPVCSSPKPSSPSDQNSNDDQKQPPPPTQQAVQPKEEPREDLDGSCGLDPPPAKPSTVASGDTIVDPKRVKRILANRQSAQRSRVRKLQYISELERSVTTLQTEVSALSPRVAFLDHQRLILNVDNSTLKQRIAALVQDNIFKDAHQEALKKEIERLRQVYQEQNLKKNMGASATPTPTASPPLTSDNIGNCADKDQPLNRDK
ncbi:Basic leucine zipper like [Actinidia chinensis var. chinensis]|uniref:Basic leucine zipper like n=1 Tax=Actinidia chinensis var. chinensis TaxID=1590841 RepID=A0A2R6QCH6_ACTCC|nr:Basic leucine zipper like [Actinidia chinensis var. chinensis]